MRKILIYTALFGDQGSLIEQPRFENVDFICYTNRNDLGSNSWKVISVAQPVESDNQLSNRYYKLLPHLHIPKNYHTSIYIDANVLILKDPTSIVYEKLNEAKIAFFDHDQNKKDPRNCIYQEHKSILELAKRHNILKDNPDVMKKQIQRFRDEGYPEGNGLISGAVLIRKHFDSKLIQVMESWWNIVSNESKRDQLSFNYVSWKLKFNSFVFIDGDIRKGNPWFLIMRHGKNYRYKILKEKLKRLFKIFS